MDINDFDGFARVDVDGIVYIVLNVIVPQVGLCVRESDVTGGAPYVATVIVGLP